jgi:hypothetical protein
METVARRIYHKLLKIRWNIGFIEFYADTVLQQDNLKIKWLKHSFRDRWFADPFILRITEQEIILLVEEFYYPIKRGRIAKLVIDKTNLKLKSNQVVLELESHLSFPAIFREGDNVYIYPENSVAGKLILYKYYEHDNTVEPVSILSNEPLTDAIISMIFGKPYLFSTKLPHQNKNSLDIYSSFQWNNTYSFDSTVYFKDNTARNAGNLFQMGNKWIRPAQDCNNGYGKGIVLQEMILENDKFSFKELKRFYPRSWRYNLGMHTLNIDKNIGIVDGRGYRRPLIAHLLYFLKNICKK